MAGDVAPAAGGGDALYARWLRHQRRDAFWKHGSVCEDIGAITCAVLAVGGWADGYTNAVFRLLRTLKGPKLGIVGPWGHKYPHNGVPGPAIGFLTESLRWWDHWLKGKATGIMDEPLLRAYVQDSLPPASHYDQRPGHWAAEPSWPSANIAAERLALDPGRLAAEPGKPVALAINSSQITGAAGGESYLWPRRAGAGAADRPARWTTPGPWSSTGRCWPSRWRSWGRRSSISISPAISRSPPSTPASAMSRRTAG